MAVLVESKDRPSLSVEPIAKMRNQLARRPATTVGAIFSSGDFTAPALALTQFLSPQTILIWPGDEIDLALKEKSMVKGLQVKYRAAVEDGICDYSLLLHGAL